MGSKDLFKDGTLHCQLKLSSIAPESVGSLTPVPPAIWRHNAADIQIQNKSTPIHRRHRRRRRHIHPLIALDDPAGFLPVQRQRSVAGSFAAQLRPRSCGQRRFRRHDPHLGSSCNSLLNYMNHNSTTPVSNAQKYNK